MKFRLVGGKLAIIIIVNIICFGQVFARNLLYATEIKVNSGIFSGRLWQKPLLIRTLTGEQNSAIESIIFTPDSKKIISGGGSNDNIIRIWDIKTGKEIRKLNGHHNRVLALAITPDGETLVSGSQDGSIVFWNLKKSNIARIARPDFSNIMSLALTPDGETLVSGSLDGIRSWNVSKQRPEKILLRSDIIYTVAISPNGQILASGSQDGSIKIWNLSSGQLINTFLGHTNAVNSLIFTPDGLNLISGSYDKTIKIWQIETGKIINSLPDFPDIITALAINPNGKTLAIASRDGIRIWDLFTNSLISFFSGHSDWVKSIAFSPDGRLLASGSYDKTIKIWQGVDY